MFYLFLAIGVVSTVIALMTLILIIRVGLGQVSATWFPLVCQFTYLTLGVIGAVWAFTQMSSVS